MLKATQLTFNPNFVNEMCILRSTSTFVEHSSCRTDVIHVTFPHVLYILGLICWDEIPIKRCEYFFGFYHTRGSWQWVKVTHFPEYLEKVSPLAAVVVFHHDHDDSFNILQPKVATIYHRVETQSQYTRSCQCWCFWRLLFLEWNLSTLWDGWGNFRRNAEYGETSMKSFS